MLLDELIVSGGKQRDLPLADPFLVAKRINRSPADLPGGSLRSLYGLSPSLRSGRTCIGGEGGGGRGTLAPDFFSLVSNEDEPKGSSATLLSISYQLPEAF